MLNKRGLALILIIVLTIGGVFTGCGSEAPGAEKPSDSEGSVKPSSAENSESPLVSKGIMEVLEDSGLMTEPFSSEEAAAEFLFDTSLNDALSESLFYMSESDIMVFSDNQYPEQRQDLVQKIIEDGQNLEELTFASMEVIDSLQADLIQGIGGAEVELPEYYQAVHGLHSEYLASILDQTLKIDMYNVSSDNAYLDSWYKEMTVMIRLARSVEVSDYFLQLSLDLVTLQDLLQASEYESDKNMAAQLKENLDVLNEKVCVLEDMINTRIGLISRLQALEEADEYYALATAYAVIETAEVAKDLLEKDFPDGSVDDDAKALFSAEIDYYLSLAEGFSNALIEHSEYGLEIPETQEDYKAGTFPVKLFGIAYADETSKAVQLKNKAGSTTQKVITGLVSFGASFTDTVAEIGTGLFTATTNIVGKTADVAYGSVKGAFASLKLAVGIDDKAAFEEQIKSVKRIINGQPGEVARILSSAASNLQKGIESKLGTVLGTIPLGNIIKKPLSFTVKGYTGLVSSLANAFDGKKPTTEKIMNLVHASTLYKADILTGAKDMFMSMGKEEMDKIIPEKAKNFYEALQTIVKKVRIDKNELLNEAKKSIKHDFDTTETGQKINGVVDDFNEKASQLHDKFDEAGSEIVGNIVDGLVKTKEAQAQSTVKVIDEAQKKLKGNIEQAKSGDTSFDYMPNDMKVLLMGFEEDLKAKAIEEVAREIEAMESQKAVYKGYLIKVTAGPFEEEIGMNVSSVIFDFGDTSVLTRYSIQGSQSMDSSSEILFSSYQKEGDNISMSTQNSSIGPVTVSGIVLDETFTGTIQFTLQGQSARMTFRTSLQK